MGSVRHETIIDVDLDTEKANAKAKQLQALIDQLSGAMRNIGGGTGGGGGGGGDASGGPAAPSPQPGASPSNPSVVPGGGGPSALVHAPNVTPGVSPTGPGGAIQPVPYAPMPAPAPGPVAPNVLPSGGDDRRTRAITQPDASDLWEQNRKRLDREDENEGKKNLSTANSSVSAALGVARAIAGGGPGMALGVAQAGISGLGDVAKSVGIGGAAIPVVGAMAGVAGIMLAGLNYRYGVAVRRAQLDERSNALGLYGGGGMGGGGYTPEEAVGIMGSFGQGAGYSKALQDTSILSLNRTGTGVGAMASYAGTSAAGIGGEGKPGVASLIATAQSSNLRGAKVDEYLQRITAAITQLGENGMSLNLEGTERFMRRLANTGSFAGSGMAQTRLLSGIEGAAVGARNQILSNYGNIGQNALTGAALRQGGGAQGAAEYLGSLSTDDKREIITREYGANAAQGYFMSLGLNEAQGRDATGPLGQERYMKLHSRGAGTLKNAYAASERRLLSMVDDKDADLFNQKSKADEIIMEIGKTGQATVDALMQVVDAVKWLLP